MDQQLREEAQNLIQSQIGELRFSPEDFRDQMENVYERINRFVSQFDQLSQEDRDTLIRYYRILYELEFNMYKTFVILMLLLLVALYLFVFFGYRLYSSLMLRERKREEKKKQKLQKKKK
ncbi:PREDICTED: uncharacterized protein LOC108562878 isoform X2 [Nicrophorus vespilloides]|uniref:Uncharacterized protein LOC108562878 isoform X2 n=1 Tax=Nicrophorus vespilloides TaxID=110193 RepID=A0ABM1MQL4_NICVS|nr:PREDICTED: uncharacterized protein LOC108562878 isoform X2 [Nicrophorus vespilloides]